MKVYFSASNDVGYQRKIFYKKIISLLKTNGLTVEQSIVSHPSKKNLILPYEFNDVYNSVLKKIDNSDVLVADISDPSGGVGYQVYHAFYSKKPIIIIYSRDSLSNPSVIIRGIKSKKVNILEYSDFADLEKKLDDALRKALSLLKVRFHLVLNNKDYSFIENISNKNGISKTKYLNKLISDTRKKDSEK